MSTSVHTLKIEERRRKVASLLAQCRAEEEIAQEMNVDQSTISRDITVLKDMSQQFIYDLAKSDLAHCYKQCIDGIEEAQRQVWEMFRNERRLSSKDKLSALKLIKECNESKFALFRDGPSILNIQVIEVQVNRIETS